MPCPSRLYVFGETQRDHEPPSSLQTKRALRTEALNLKVAVLLATRPEGPAVIFVFRAAASAGDAKRRIVAETTMRRTVVHAVVVRARRERADAGAR